MGMLDVQQWNIFFLGVKFWKKEEDHIAVKRELARSVNYFIALLVRKV